MDPFKAAKLIQGLRTSEQQPTDKPQPETAPKAETPTQETGQPTAETPVGDTKQEETLYTVKVNGEELNVTLDDLKKGYMMESDYRKKTTSVSEKRKALDAQQGELDQSLNEARELLQSEFDWFETDEAKELREDDPEDYLTRYEKLRAKNDKLSSLSQKRQEQMTAKQKEAFSEQVEKLNNSIPDWLDGDKRADDVKKMLSGLKKSGYSEEEAKSVIDAIDTGEVYDHRFFVLARKAALYDAIQSQNIEAKKVKTPPQTMVPGAKTDIDAQSEERKQLKAKLNKSGSIKDAAALFRMR